MVSRSVLALLSSLIVTASAVACTTTVIQREVAAGPAAADGGDTTDPDAGDQPVTEAGVDSGNGPFVFKPAPDGTFAQAITFGGSVVKAPKVVPIVFASDTDKQTPIDFVGKLATSKYWGQISSEYGVGALSAKTAIVVSELPPSNIDDSQVAQWISNKFSTDAAHFGAPASDTLYAIFYPAGTTVTQASGTSCKEFGGYHFETTAGATSISYAVVPRCTGGFAGLNGLDVTTFAASHEILEWATDPFPQSRPAYESVDDDHAVWGRVFLGELGDLCAQMEVQVTPPDLGFVVQRTWSNVSAKAGHHPCAPVGTGPYFTAFPSKLDAINVSFLGQNITTQGLQIPVGQKKTIDLTMYADKDTPSWQVQIIDLTQLSGAPAEFSYSLDKSSGKPGDTLHLTITAEQSAQSGQGFLIVSQTKTDSNLWPVWVTN